VTAKYIDGSYPGGYAIGTGIDRLIVSRRARIGTDGIGGTGSWSVRITNLGAVAADAIHDGVHLTGGGAVTNAGKNASITGYHGVYIAGGEGRIVNRAGTIGSALYRGPAYTRYASAVLEDGGVVINASGATITNGIDVSGGTGNVANDGAIGGVYSSVHFFHGFEISTGPAIVLSSGGKVTNGAHNPKASIAGGVDISGGAGQVVNAGAISGYYATIGGPPGYGNSHRAGQSVILENGGDVLNRSTGTLANGVAIGGDGILRNFGRIGAGFDSSGYYGANVNRLDSVDLSRGGVLNGSESDTTAQIGGGLVGVSITGGWGRVTNFGSIVGVVDSVPPSSGHFSAGIRLAAGGIVANGSEKDSSAVISGYDSGIFAAGARAFVRNFGTITETSAAGGTKAFAGQAGVALDAGGVVVNGDRRDRAAKISGAVGLAAYGPADVVNYGTIAGVMAAIDFHSARDRLVEQGSGVLIGPVMGGKGALVLGNQGGAGTLTGLGSTIAGFGRIDVYAGPAWTLTGTNTVGTATVFRNKGTVIDSGTLTLESGIVGAHGLIRISANASAEVDKLVVSGQTIAFAGTQSSLILDDAADFKGAIASLGGAGGETLALKGFGAGTRWSFVANATNTGGTLRVTDGTFHAAIRLLGQYAAAGFHAEIGATETVFSYAPPPPAVPHLAPTV
jgi:hypothetical protein